MQSAHLTTLDNITIVLCVIGVFAISRLIGKRFSGEEITGSVSFSDLLLKYAHVAVTPAKAFGADDHVRLSYAVDRKSIEEGLKRIAGFVAGLE